jgi:hypothetical protein
VWRPSGVDTLDVGLEETRRPLLVNTRVRRTVTAVSVVPSADHVAESAATLKRSRPLSSTTWTRPSYGPVANSPCADQLADPPPLGTLQTSLPAGVYARIAPSVCTATSDPSGDHETDPKTPDRASARGAPPGVASDNVMRFTLPAVSAIVLLSGDHAICTYCSDGNPIAGTRRRPVPSISIAHRPPVPARSLRKATSLPFGETIGCVSCHGLCVRLTTRPFPSARYTSPLIRGARSAANTMSWVALACEASLRSAAAASPASTLTGLRA